MEFLQENFVELIFTGFVFLVWYIWSKLVARVKTLEKKVESMAIKEAKMEANFVSHQDLDEAVKELRSEMKEGHQLIITDIRDMRNKMDAFIDIMIGNMRKRKDD